MLRNTAIRIYVLCVCVHIYIIIIQQTRRNPLLYRSHIFYVRIFFFKAKVILLLLNSCRQNNIPIFVCVKCDIIEPPRIIYIHTYKYMCIFIYFIHWQTVKKTYCTKLFGILDDVCTTFTLLDRASTHSVKFNVF